MTIKKVHDVTSLTTQPTSKRARASGIALRLVGAGLLVATAGIHLDLYLTGYRHIPTIGVLFLLQVIAAFLLGVLVLALSRPVVALAGAGFAASTLGGYILSLWIGLFGFNEVRTTAGIVAGVVEVAAFIALTTYALVFASAPTTASEHLQGTARRALAPLGALAVLALVLAVSLSSGAPSGSSSGSGSGSGSPVKGTSITISNFMFSPMSLSVAPGATVKVTNKDSATHTLTANDNAFNTGDITQNQTKTFKAPMKPGTYSYICNIHQYMMGTIIVK
jgi:plastocyanin